MNLSISKGILKRLTGLRFISGITNEKRNQIESRVAETSNPSRSFYVMACLSAIIAAYGLLANSSAVVIGAMLVAPLMGPIFGIALGLSTGNRKLLRDATLSELLGILLSIGLAFMIGAIAMRPDFGSEIIARTQPTIYDVLIALASGMAGAYAMVDERISPALPGVAIATALVPPLATVGLCISASSWDGARGALLLFIVNLLAIETAAGAIFTIYGLIDKDGATRGTIVAFLKKFGITFLVVALVAAFMTQTLVRIISNQRFNDRLRSSLSNEVSSVNGARLSDVYYEKQVDHYNVMAVVMTPREFEPDQVVSMEKVLRQQIDSSINLVVRSLISKDADKKGPVFLSDDDKLNQVKLSENNQFLASVTKILNGQLRAIPGATMTDMYSSDSNTGGQRTITAVVRTPSPVTPTKVADIEKAINQSVKPPVRLVIRSVITRDANSQSYIYEKNGTLPALSGEQLVLQQKLESVLKEQILRRTSEGSKLAELRFAEIDNQLVVLAVVDTPYTIRPPQVAEMEAALKASVDPRVILVVRSVLGADTASEGYLPDFDESILNPSKE